MKRLGRICFPILLVSTSFLGVACDTYEPVPVSSCDQVVSHARKLLGKEGGSWSELNKSCQTASDQERGCVTIADSAADILRCSM